MMTRVATAHNTTTLLISLDQGLQPQELLVFIVTPVLNCVINHFN